VFKAICPISFSEQDRLDRNGVAHKVSAAYQFTFAEKHRITPEIALSYDDLDGEVMANTGVDLKLNYTYLTGAHSGFTAKRGFCAHRFEFTGRTRNP
jgi:hypothetical protein